MKRVRINRHVELKSYTPIKRTRMKPKFRSRETETVGKYSGKVRLYGKALTDLRQRVYERAGGWCELMIAKDCWRSTTWDAGHMHHKRHRSLGGSDTMRNCVWSCPSCHRKEHNQ